MPVKQVRVELYRPVIKSVLHEMAGKETFRVTMRVLSRAQVLCPVDQGNLRAAHGIKFKSTETRQIGEVSNKVKYALPVHEGRRALTIFPKKKQALAFTWHGQQMVRRSVHQPARRGKPWLRDALIEVAAQEGYKMQSTAATDSGGTL